MQRRLIRINFVGLLLCLLLAGCGREPLYQSQGYVFGTLVEVSIYGEPEAHARELADHVLQDFQGVLTGVPKFEGKQLDGV